MKAIRILAALLILAVCGISIFLWISIFRDLYAFDAPSKIDGQRNAVSIIAGLDKYQMMYQNYPSDLSALISNGILLSIPQPNKEYEYVYFNYGDSYRLGFKERGSDDGWYCYNSLEKQWTLYDSTC